MPWKGPNPPILRPRDQVKPRDINCILENQNIKGGGGAFTFLK
jgi:hypothetical protein